MTTMKKDTINLNQKEVPLTERIRAFNKFAGQTQKALLDLFMGGVDIPFHISGTQGQIDSFMKVLSREKRYMDSYRRNGLNDPRTLNSRHSLAAAVQRFEGETGLRWPFKN